MRVPAAIARGTGGVPPSRGDIYRRMLQHPRYLFRPWIPFVKAIEGELFARQRLAPLVLDLACGDGIFAWATYCRPLDIGIDRDVPALAEARRLGAYRHLAAADARALPFRSESFPTVTSVCAVEHMDGLSAVLRELSRVLAPGGRLFLTVPSEQFGALLLGSRIWRALGCPGRAAAYGARKNRRSHHVNILGVEAWRRALGAESLRVVATAHLLSPGAMTVWSLLTSSPFKLAFLPFRAVRERDWPRVERLLRRLLLATLAPFLDRAAGGDQDPGGYLFLLAEKGGA
jgi:SAM-dependent methyltransferase